MTYKLKRILLITILMILMLVGLGIFIYYLLVGDISDVRTLPPYFLMMVVVYIVGQLLKRFFQDKTPWYGWMYYIGLIAVIIPLPFFSLGDNLIFLIVRIGALFLILPPLIEFVSLIKDMKIGDKSTIQ